MPQVFKCLFKIRSCSAAYAIFFSDFKQTHIYYYAIAQQKNDWFKLLILNEYGFNGLVFV